jgi:hypothetical protein
MSTTFEITPNPTDVRFDQAVAHNIGGIMLGNLIEGQEAEAAPGGGLGYLETGLPFSPENLFAPELAQNPVEYNEDLPGGERIFNGTVLDIDGTQYIFARKVVEAAPAGKPDSGPLVMARLSPEGAIIAVHEVWNPEGKDVLIEDPRALQYADGRTVIGITAVDTTKGNKTSPGIMDLINSRQLLTEPFPVTRIFERFEGSKTTPIGGDVEGKNDTPMDGDQVIYRPEGLDHTLQLLGYDENDAVHVAFIDFPKNIPWALYKIGTTTPPDWLNDQEAFFEFHGINKTIDGEIVDPDCVDENVIFEYGIGTCRLVRIRSEDENASPLFFVDNISWKPILTPDSFPEPTDGRQVELHPEKRRALYNCGLRKSTRNEKDELLTREIIPSQGDMRSKDVIYNAGAIIAGWDRTIPAEYHLTRAA